LEYNGEVKKLVEWAEQYNIGSHRLHERVIKRKWNVERALHTPCPKGFQGEFDERRAKNKELWELKGHLYAARSNFRKGKRQELLTLDLLQVEGFDSDDVIFKPSEKRKLPEPVIVKAEIPEGKTNHKVTKDLIRQIISMKKAGRTIRDIARIAGLPRSTVFYHLKKHGVTNKK
jgi:transcriptional regulator with GAF, ATPase, and Fis domain